MFSWQFSNKKEHGPTWYIIAAIITISFVVYGIISGLYLLSIVFFLLAGTYLLMENNSSPTLQITFNEGGFVVGETVYEFKDFVSFAILSVDGVAKLLRFQPKKRFAPVIDIPMTQDVNPIELRNWLKEILPENENAHFTTADAILDITKI